MDKNPNFVTFILLVKCKLNREHVLGLNCVLTNTIDFFLNSCKGVVIQ
jgi:hypothetical protein